MSVSTPGYYYNPYGLGMFAPATRAVDYLYDTENRWIGRDVDLDGDGKIDTRTRFAYDGNQIVMQFDRADATAGDPADPLTVDELSHRYLWNPAAVDQLMADEQVTDPDVVGDIAWPLADHLGTIRDLVAYDAATNATTVVNHRTFDAYGNFQSQTNAAVDCLFAYTGRPLDQETGLQNNLHRWYDPAVGRWISEDPIGFEGRDGNLYVYVGNGPMNAVDPTGLQFPEFPPGWTAAANQAMAKAEAEQEARLERWNRYYNQLGSAAELEEALMYAHLAQGAYVFEKGDVCLGWEVIDFTDLKNGYRSVLYRRRRADGTFEYVRAFAGTDQGRDWITNFLQSQSIPEGQYLSAEKQAKRDVQVCGSNNLHFVGHSLGGGLALTAAIVTGVGATTFNAAGVNRVLGLRYPDNWARQRELITAYRVVGEVLTTLQDGFFPVGWCLPNTNGRLISLYVQPIARHPSRNGEWTLPQVTPDDGAVTKHLMPAVIQALQSAYELVRSRN